MDEERRDLIRRMFVALTVLAEHTSEYAVEGQSPAIDDQIAIRLANRLIDASQTSGLLSEAISALARS